MVQDKGTLEKAKEILAASGLKPIDYKHLPYNEILKLAGISKN